MEKKVLQFSKIFLPCGIVSILIILSGIAGFILRGINLGIDFKPGLIEEICIAPPVAELSYDGSAKVTADISKDRFDLVISGAGAENETKTYLYSEYPRVSDIAAAVNSLENISMSLKTDGSESSYKLFMNSAVSTILGKDPIYLYADISNVSIDEIRSAVKAIQGTAVKELGTGENTAFQIRIPVSTENGSSQEMQRNVLKTLSNNFGEEKIVIVKTDFIGSGFSKILAQKSILLLCFTTALIWAYAAIRFHWDFALGAVIALIHDAAIMLTFIVWTRIEFSTTVLAAVLTIIGYSINDTVVILDRVRSNIRLKKVSSFNELLDVSLSGTLSRSVITTLTTLFAVISLFIFTSGSIKDFSLALIVGLLSGLYSSLFISSGFISLFRKNWKQEYGIHHSEKTQKGVLTFDSGIVV